jgi:hypothetical protein
MAHRSATVKINVDVTPFVAKIADAQLDAHLLGCRVCAHYVRRRGNTLRLAVVVEAERHGISAPLLMCRYVINSVHARHLAGDTLSTRPFTEAKALAAGGKQMHVKRICNGCGNNLGDVRPDEIDAAVAGEPLPDVRLECGCWTEAAA